MLVDTMKRTLPAPVLDRGRAAVERMALARLKSLSISRDDFLRDVRSAVAERRGYAAAKVGASQKHWMYYEIFLRKHRDNGLLAEYEKELVFHSLQQEGLFPPSVAFYREYNRFYVDHIKNLDCLGICYRPARQELEIIRHYGLTNRFIYYPFQEPDGSTTTDEANCYLPAFRDKKLLIVCPFARVLRDRAQQDIFEAIWRKTGRKWFHPSHVEALEFPYGFAAETHQRYPTVLRLFDEITTRLNSIDFDVALIGAGGLAVPIASHIKSMGKVAIDLGGHLQIVFGVIGQRWRTWENWKRDYFNEHWIDMPAHYRPKETNVCDGGAYW